MSDSTRRLLGIGIPCLLAFLLDSGLTLHGQPAEYWAGDYSNTNEGGPLFRRLFMYHPLAVVAGYAVWAGILAGLIVLLPEVLAVIFSIAVVFGHVGGAYSWLTVMINVGWYQTANGLFLAAAIILGVGLHWYLRGPVPKRSESRMPIWLRWGLILLLVAMAGSMIFVPW